MPSSAFDPDCEFCRIARGEESSTPLICEGPSWVAFFPLAPATPGHTLVVPRIHVRHFWALEPSLAADLAQAALRLGRALTDVMTPDGMNLITSAGEAAEQTVSHVHLHVVPRWQGDRIGPIWPFDSSEISHEVAGDLARRLRAACARDFD